jgi:hypothetical protein
VVVVASAVAVAVSVAMTVVLSEAPAVVVATAVSVLRVSEAESVTVSVSVESVTARDVNRTVVVSPISVDMVAVVSRPVMVVAADDEGRHGPALTPARAIKAIGPERKCKRAMIKSDKGSRAKQND